MLRSGCDIWGQSKKSLEFARILEVRRSFYSDPKYLVDPMLRYSAKTNSRNLGE
jgi:hypothetical protein